jgi:flavodoxin
MGDLSGMTVDAITSASLNAKTENTQGNLQVMAQAIQEVTGAEVFPIHVEETHDPVYLNMVMGAGEDQENNRTFTVIGLPEDFNDYDTIYFGTPVWHAQLPQPVASFLQQVDWSGKQVIVFGIHLGSGWGRNIQQIKDLQPNADVIEGMTVYASAANGEARQEMMNYLNK